MNTVCNSWNTVWIWQWRYKHLCGLCSSFPSKFDVIQFSVTNWNQPFIQCVYKTWTSDNLSSCLWTISCKNCDLWRNEIMWREWHSYVLVKQEYFVLRETKIQCTENCWMKIDQLDVTCFIISLFNAQHVSNISTSILRSLRLICWVI